MPVRTERYTELECALPVYSLVTCLVLNFVLMLLCCILGLLTRHLPDNFNESWYIFLSVCTTLFIWIAFLPTYFNAFYAIHKAALLALALILNGYAIIICLFGPKMYALYYIKESDIKTSNFNASSYNTDISAGTSNSTIDKKYCVLLYIRR